MKEQVPGSFRAGDMWSFRSKASEDLDELFEKLNLLPRCDTKKELIQILRCARSKIEVMMSEIKKAGTDYTLEDAE